MSRLPHATMAALHLYFGLQHLATLLLCRRPISRPIKFRQEILPVLVLISSAVVQFSFQLLLPHGKLYVLIVSA